MSKFDSHKWHKAFQTHNALSEEEKKKVTIKDLLHTDKVDGKKADKVDIKIGAENDLAIEKDKKGRDVYAQGLTEAPIPGSVDYSTINLKSNIDQKWKSTLDMHSDLSQWLSAASAAMGDSAVKEIGEALHGLGLKTIAQAKGKDKVSGTSRSDALSKKGGSRWIDRASGGLYS